MNRRVLFAAVFLLLLLVGFYALIPWRAPLAIDASPSETPSSLPRMGAGGPLSAIAPAGPATPVDLGAFSVPQARAYALLGEVLDGRKEQMPVLDKETQASLETMRQLLAAQTIRRGLGSPTVSAEGATTSVIGGGAAPTHDAGSTTAVPSASKDVATKPLDSAAAKKSLVLGNATGTVTSADNLHTITGRDAWAAIKAQPGRGLPLRIVDHGEGGHVIALFGEDFGTVRVNGGLVVPGRYYRINGSVEISGMVPLGIHIRPLNAVPSYQETVVTSPSANG